MFPFAMKWGKQQGGHCIKCLKKHHPLAGCLSLPAAFPQRPHSLEENPFAGAIKWCWAFNNISRWHLPLLLFQRCNFSQNLYSHYRGDSKAVLHCSYFPSTVVYYRRFKSQSRTFLPRINRRIRSVAFIFELSQSNWYLSADRSLCRWSICSQWETISGVRFAEECAALELFQPTDRWSVTVAAWPALCLFPAELWTLLFQPKHFSDIRP